MNPTTKPDQGQRDQRPLPVRLQSRLAGALAIVASVSLVAMAALITGHILLRALTGTGFRGANELSQYLMITLVYCGLAAALRDGGFIRVDLLLKRLPRVPQAATAALVRLLSLAFMALLTWRTWELMLESQARGLESIGVLRLPLWLPQLVVAIGCTALTLQVLVLLAWPNRTGEISSYDEAEAEMKDVEAVLHRGDTESLDAGGRRG